jgi:hypothetical protein
VQKLSDFIQSTIIDPLDEAISDFAKSVRRIDPFGSNRT